MKNQITTSHGIGSGDIAGILGVDKYNTPYQIYLRKINNEPIPDNAYMKAGRKLEPVIIDYFCEETNSIPISSSQVLLSNKLILEDRIIFVKNDWQVSQIDTFYSQESFRKSKIKNFNEWLKVLECKNTTQELDEPLDSWFAQHQWQLNTCDLRFGEIGWFEKGYNFKHREYEIDFDFINICERKGGEFWFENVLKQIPPAPVNSDDILAMFQSHIAGRYIEAVDDVYNEWLNLKSIQSQIKELSVTENELKEKLKLVIGNSEGLSYSEKILCTWKYDKDSIKIDSKLLKESEPDIFEKYSKIQPGARKFLVK